MSIEQKIAEILGVSELNDGVRCQCSSCRYKKKQAKAILALITEEQKPLVEALEAAKGKLEGIQEHFKGEYGNKPIQPLWYATLEDYIQQIDTALKGVGR